MGMAKRFTYFHLAHLFVVASREKKIETIFSLVILLFVLKIAFSTKHDMRYVFYRMIYATRKKTNNFVIDVILHKAKKIGSVHTKYNWI